MAGGSNIGSKNVTGPKGMEAAPDKEKTALQFGIDPRDTVAISGTKSAEDDDSNDN